MESELAAGSITINISNLSLSSLFPLYIWKVFLSADEAGSTMAMLTKGICLRNSNHQAGSTNVKQCLLQVGGSREGARGGDGRGAPKVGGLDQYFLFVAYFAYFAYVAYLQLNRRLADSTNILLILYTLHFVYVAYFAYVVYFAYVAYLQSKVGGLNEDVAQV